MGLLDIAPAPQQGDGSSYAFTNPYTPPTDALGKLALIGGALQDIGRGADNDGSGLQAARQQLAQRQQAAQQLLMTRMNLGFLQGAAQAMQGGAGAAAGGAAAGAPQTTYAANQPTADALSGALTNAGLTSTPAPAPPMPANAPNVGPPPTGAAPSGGAPLNGMQRGFGLYALAQGKPADAWSIMAPRYAVGPGGQLYDRNSAALGPRIPDYTYTNGWRTDAGSPTAPDYLPTLPQGLVPNGQGGVSNIPGFTGAMGDQTAATSNAQEAAKANYDLVEVPIGQNGQTIKLPRSIAVPILAARATNVSGILGTVAPAGANAPAGLGVTPTPAQTDFDKAQAAEASKQLSSDMDARGGALQQLDDAKTALAYVASHPNDMNPATPHFVAGANYLRTLPPATLKSIGVDPALVDRYANDAAVYQRLSSQNLLSFSKSNLPSRYTEREMAVAGRVIPQLSTAPDAASFHWGLQAAIANKAVQRADFAANYKGAPSRQGVEQAWDSTPEGQASLFQDPVWRNIQIGGKPAVVYKTIGNKTYGAVGIGTGHPTFFLAVP